MVALCKATQDGPPLKFTVSAAACCLAGLRFQTALSQEHGPNIQLGPLYPTSLHIEAGQPGEIGTAPLLDARAKFTNGEPDRSLLLGVWASS